ncbi:MAG: hypothetical protein AB8B72_14245 [Crocinitomicaceae bacterium]
MKYILTVLTLATILLTTDALAQEPVVYRLHHIEYNRTEESIDFFSVSDRYYESGPEVDSAIPKSYFENKSGPVQKFIKLKGEYRKRCMDAIGASENDVVYTYDYARDKLLRYYIRSLYCVAVLSIYSSGAEYPIDQNEYMIGFQIKSKYLTGYHSHVLVSIGKTNPFTRGQVKPILWEKASADAFPREAKSFEEIGRLKTGNYGNTYQFKMEGLTYLVQNIMFNNVVLARHLVVKNSASNLILLDRFYIDSESASPAPLNSVEPENNDFLIQYAGNLFKYKPPVIFGFMWQSFGCPRIDVIKPDADSIYIHCDNRH